MKKNKALYYSGIVWMAAGIGLTVFATVSMLFENIPGLEMLITWLTSLTGRWILIAVLIAMIIEGLYFVGSFFPGSSVVVVLAILSQTDSLLLFVATILTIFIGWVLAGLVNIYVAKQYGLSDNPDYKVVDRYWTTWFPSFRANYEVSQMASGASAREVFRSSVRVKSVVSLIMGVVVYFLALFLDVSSLSDKEGFATLYVSAAIMLIVGIAQIRKSDKS